MMLRQWIRPVRELENPDAPELAEGPFIERKQEPAREFEGAWMEMRKGIRLVYLHGSAYEMGRQHATLLQEEMMGSIFPFFSGFLQRQFKHSLPGPIVDLLLGIMNRTVLKKAIKGFDEYDREPFFGMADALGMDRDELLRICLVPDMLQYAAGLVYRTRLTKSLPQPMLGCTSFAAKGDGSADGHVWLGHNEDYPGMEHWDRFPTAFFCQPDHAYRHVVFATPGIHSATMMSLNEHGLALTAHTFITADVRIDGTPIFPVGRRVMERARTVKEAVSILSGIRFMVGWNLLLVDRNGDVATVETSGQENSVNFWPDDVSAHGNVYCNSCGQAREVTLGASIRSNLEQRYVRMGELLGQWRGRIGPEAAVSMLSDHYDILIGEHRAAGNVIAQIQNIMSTVIDCTDLRFWVSDGQAPVCYGTYRGFQFEDGFQRRFGETTDYESPSRRSPRYRGVRQYIQAEHAIQMRSDYATAAILLERAVELDESEFLYPAMAGIVYVYLRQYERARALLELAETRKDVPQRKAMARLWLARAFDLSRNRAEAKAIYRSISRDDRLDTAIRKAARKSLYWRFRTAGLRRFLPDFWMGDSLKY